MQIEYKKLTEITPYENNPRKNDDAVDYVANSIKEFGFKNPIIIDKDGVIVAGHTRYKAAQQLGMEEVPTIKADDLTPEQIKAFRLADNKTAEIAEWDFNLLDEELNILDFDMSQFGFTTWEDTGYIESFFDEGVIETSKDKKYKLTILFDSEDEKNEHYELLKEQGYEVKK